MDKYIIKDDGMMISFYKNDKLHREVGPASFWKEDEDKYYHLGDEHLYSVFYSTLSDEVMQDLDGVKSWARDASLYYLDGIQYNKEEFNRMIAQKNAETLEKELNAELNNKKTDKKLKI